MNVIDENLIKNLKMWERIKLPDSAYVRRVPDGVVLTELVAASATYSGILKASQSSCFIEMCIGKPTMPKDPRDYHCYVCKDRTEFVYEICSNCKSENTIVDRFS